MEKQKRVFKQMVSLNWLKDRLVGKGYPVRIGSVGRKRLILGPLTIVGSTYTMQSYITGSYGSQMKPGEGQAFAVIRAVHLPPDSVDGQVVMSLESFAQIVEWLIEKNPDSFLRPVKRKGFE